MYAQISGAKDNNIPRRGQIVTLLAMMTRTKISMKGSVQKSHYELITT